MALLDHGAAADLPDTDYHPMPSEDVDFGFTDLRLMLGVSGLGYLSSIYI